MKFTVYDNFTEKAAALIADRSNKAENVVAEKARADTEKYVPFLTGNLEKRVRVIGNTIIYPGPYARYLYYGVKMVEIGTGRGPFPGVDKYGNEGIFYHKGSKLRPTDTPLKYTGRDYAGPHKLAGPKWFERSKAQNLKSWLETAEKWVNTGHE